MQGFSAICEGAMVGSATEGLRGASTEHLLAKSV